MKKKAKYKTKPQIKGDKKIPLEQKKIESNNKSHLYTQWIEKLSSGQQRFCPEWIERNGFREMDKNYT